MLQSVVLVIVASLGTFAGVADAAIFRLNSTSTPCTGSPCVYNPATIAELGKTASISGTFSVNTGSASDLMLTSWNIRAVASTGSDYTFNSSNGGVIAFGFGGTTGDADQFQLCDTAGCVDSTKTLLLVFDRNFDQVYYDPVAGVDQGAGVGNGVRLSNTALLTAAQYEDTLVAGTNIFQFSPNGQADFVPFSLSFLAFAPILRMGKAMKRNVALLASL